MKQTRFAILSAMLLLVGRGPAVGAENVRTLVVRVPPVLVVDPGKNSAVGLIHVRNEATGAVQVHLTADDFVAESTGKLLGAAVTFAAPGAASGGPIYDETLLPGRTQAIRVEATNLWEAGESTAKLRNGEQEVATLRAVKYQVPLGVTIVGSGEEPRVVAFQRSQARDVILKNEDAMTYVVDWRLTIGSAVATGRATLPPNWTTPIAVTPPEAWFSAPIEGLFRDETREGALAVRLSPSSEIADARLPERVIPLRAQLAYWPSWWRNPATVVLVFVVLLAGGLCSLLLNQWFPNRLRRIDLEERLTDIAGRIRSLSLRVDSSARILARVERYRLLRLLGSRYAFSPEMARMLTVGAQATDRLEAKVALLERADSVCHDLLRLSAVQPPTLTALVEERLVQAGDRLRGAQPTETDLQEATALITEAARRLNAAGQADPEFAKTLIDRFKALGAVMGSECPLRKTPKGEQLEERLRGLFKYLDDGGLGSSTGPEGYFDHDLRLLRLDLVYQYLRHYYEQTKDAQGRIDRYVDAACLDYVAGATAEQYRQGQLVLTAMRQDAYPEEVEDAIRAGQLRIEVQPADPRPHQAVELSVVFDEVKFNSCGAREKFECLWKFTHVDSDGRPGDWREKGWRVYHFFPKPGTYPVSASFRGRDGKEIANQDKHVKVNRDIEVGRDTTPWFGGRTWIEAARFGIVLCATVLGLLGGAREQLMKLDVVAGLVAVFLIGFGADAVKNILVERGTAPEPTRK